MPRDNESLIDIERAARRVLRYASDCDRVQNDPNEQVREFATPKLAELKKLK